MTQYTLHTICTLCGQHGRVNASRHIDRHERISMVCRCSLDTVIGRVIDIEQRQIPHGMVESA